MRRTLLVLIALLMFIGVAITALAPGAAADAPPAPIPPVKAAQTVCPTGWGSAARVVTTMSQAPITNVRVGRHACYDRLAIDIAGKAGGYRVEYVTTVFSEGRGAPLYVPGGAKLSVNVLDPTTRGYRVNTAIANVAGFTTFRSVTYGGSFEGHTQLGLGVRARLPFRVWVLPTPTGSILVVDVAHKW